MVQLVVDADSMAPYMALPATHIRPSPLSFSFIPSTVYGIFSIRLIDSDYSVCLDISRILACLLRQSAFQ